MVIVPLMANEDLHPSPAEPFNAADPEQVKEAADRAARHEAEERAVLAQVLETRAGRRWIWGHLSRANIFAPSFVAGDPHATSFNEGQRNMGLMMLAQVVRVSPETFGVMQKENSGNG